MKTWTMHTVPTGPGGGPFPLEGRVSMEAGMQADRAKSGSGGARSVGLITLSHRGDLERCALLFDSIDRHVTLRGTHYVVVDDEDVALFAPFARADRRILPLSGFVPRWMRPIPGLRWRGRRYWWSFYGKPISGWHIQQIVKIEAARSLAEERFCLIDSDIYFFRDFDLGSIADPNPTPFHVHPGGVTEERPSHKLWVATASRLIGTTAPGLPADDYIDQIIVWDQPTVRAMTARIEAVAGRDWIAAMCRDRNFSEYMIYGAFVAATPAFMARHAPTTQSFTRTHWDADPLGVPDILAMLRSASPAERAVCIQSFGSTPVSTIRTSLDLFYSATVGEKHKSRTEAA